MYVYIYIYIYTYIHTCIYRWPLVRHAVADHAPCLGDMLILRLISISDHDIIYHRDLYGPPVRAP